MTQPFDPWADKGQEYYNQCIATALAGVATYPDTFLPGHGAGLLDIAGAEAALAALKASGADANDPNVVIYMSGLTAAKANQAAAQAFLDGTIDQYTPTIGANHELELLKSQGLVDVHIVPTKDELAAALAAATAPA